jgi:hypothetical protein
MNGNLKVSFLEKMPGTSIFIYMSDFSGGVIFFRGNLKKDDSMNGALKMLSFLEKIPETSMLPMF